MAVARVFDHTRYATLRGVGRVGARVHVADQTATTMDDARVGADERGPAGCGDAYLAYEQTAGRGRLGRRWLSAPGSALLVTYHLCPQAHVHAPLISAAGGLAAATAIEATTTLRTEQKWPNDVLVDGRKLVGVLADARRRAGRLEVFLGIGINLRDAAIAALPPSDRDRATSIEGAGATPPDLEPLLASLSRSLEARMGQLDGDPSAFLSEWRSRLATLGRRVRLATVDSEIEGLAVDVTELGELTLRLDGGSTRSFAAGDVTTVPDGPA